MNLDFILFTPPKAKYTFMDFWGQVIFIPKYKKIKQKQEQTFLGSVFSCYTSTKTTQSSLTVDYALLNVKGFYSQIQEAITQQMTEAESEQIQKYIPCLYLDSMVKSEYIILYFHSSGEDIKLSHNMLNHLRNSYQINIIAMQYPGYSIHKGKTSSVLIKQEAKILYQYIIEKLGFKQDKIIIIGRSIGTGIALELMQTINPAALVLISPFVNIKSLAKQIIGNLGHFLAKQTYDNLSNVKNVKCPTFLLHGKKDQLISFQNSIQLAKNCSGDIKTNFPSKMTHGAFDYYIDLTDPLREFLMQKGINFYKQGMQGPQVPDQLFKCPQKLNI